MDIKQSLGFFQTLLNTMYHAHQVDHLEKTVAVLEVVQFLVFVTHIQMIADAYLCCNFTNK